MTRKAPLPKITECVEQNRETKGVSRLSLAQAVYPFMVVAALCLGHVHLQFQAIDMKIQQTHLQMHNRDLLKEEAFLERENEALCEMSRLKAFASRDLNMMELNNPTEKLMASVSQELENKYLSPLGDESSAAVAHALDEHERSRGGFQSVLLSLLDGSRAFASAGGN